MSYIDFEISNQKIFIIVLLIKTTEDNKNNFSKINYFKKSEPKYKTFAEYENIKVIEIDFKLLLLFNGK